jgi:O-antigen/teichoic acid export membrane protein
MSSFTPSVKRNVLVSWLAHGVAIVVGFFLMPYMLGVLGERSYGTWVFINSLASYAGLLYFGFGDTISRYVAKYHAAGDIARLNRVVTLVLTIYAVMGSVALLIAGGLAYAAPWLSTWEGEQLQEVQVTILVLGLNVAISMVGSVFGGVLMGMRRFDLERTVGFSSDLIRAALVILFLQQKWGLVTIALIYFVIALVENVSFVVLAFRCLPQLQVRRANLSWETFRECSSFSSMAFLSAIAYQLTTATDSVVIGFALGAEAIVPYYIALRLTQFIRQPIDKIAHICLPTAGALSAETERSKLHRFLVQAIGLVFLLSTGMFIGGWFFGGDVIRTWMGDQYADSHHLLVILLAAQVFSLPCGILRAFLFGLGSVRAAAVLYLTVAVCNLVLSVWLCRLWGVAGVAWGTLIPVVLIEVSCLLPYALYRLKLTWRRLWTDAIAPQLLPLAALASYSWLVAGQPWSHAGWPTLITVTLGGGAVLGSVWLLSQRWIVGRLQPST